MPLFRFPFQFLFIFTILRCTALFPVFSPLMASPTSHAFNHNNSGRSNISYASLPAAFDPSSMPNTTFVQADPSNFRAVVQKLTGATQDNLLTHKLPGSAPAHLAGKSANGEMGPPRPGFKLHERRQSARKLEIKLNNDVGGASSVGCLGSPSASAWQRPFLGFPGEMIMVSPVSPLELLARGSPRTPRSPSEEEDRVIAEKGFYLHPSPLNTPRGSEPPELLPLFPLHSPRYDDSSTTS